MSEVRVRIDGATELAARLRKFGVKILDLRDSMDKSGRYLTSFYSGQVFASRGGIIGRPWARLSDKYAADKAQRYPGRPPLIRTGLMNRSFKYAAGRLSVEVTNEAKYFPYHQEGTSRIPARVMMGLNDTLEGKVVGFVEDDLRAIQVSSDV